MYNDSAKKNVLKPKSKMGQPKKVCNDTAKKNVCKPESKMGQPKKVCNDTAKKNVWKPKNKVGHLMKIWDTQCIVLCALRMEVVYDIILKLFGFSHRVIFYRIAVNHSK